MKRWTRLNNTLLLFFAALSALCLTGGYYADGICIWLSFLTLLVWPILAVNLLLLVIQLFTKKKWKGTVPLLAILLHADYLSAVYQLPYCSKPAVSEQEGTPLTVVTYNASHFYWNRKYTMNEAAAYIKHYNPISSASRKLPVTDITIGTASGTLSIMYCINISAGVQTIYRLRSTAVIRSIR